MQSARWAAAQGLPLLLGNVSRAETHEDFVSTQCEHVAVYRRGLGEGPPPRVAAGRVLVPTDGVDAATGQRLRDFAAQRQARTQGPQGARRSLFAADVVGSAAQIVAALQADPVLQQVQELRVELPYELPASDYRRILQIVAEQIAPALGWRAFASAA